jgi:DNA-binding FadR family transcriptional regulator
MTAPTGRRHADGSIDFDFYRAEARILRNEARSNTCRKLWAVTRNAVAYFKFPQNRWMRRQASSRSSVLVA